MEDDSILQDSSSDLSQSHSETEFPSGTDMIHSQSDSSNSVPPNQNMNAVPNFRMMESAGASIEVLQNASSSMDVMQNANANIEVLQMNPEEEVIQIQTETILSTVANSINDTMNSSNFVQSHSGISMDENSANPIIQVESMNDSNDDGSGLSPSVFPMSDGNPMGCLICGDKGSGYHYSVFSCEGCKGFFKRSVQKNLVYTCKNEGDCVINKFTRNSCQYCRFVKCTQMGMKREAVREDRSPGGKHRHKRPRLDEVRTVMGPDGKITIIQEEALEVDSSSFEDKLVEGLVNARPDMIPRVDGNAGLQSMGINQLMQYGYAELKYIIDWAKRVPGFPSLCIEDQMALLKSSFMELNVLRLSFRSMDSDNSIKFAEGLKVPVELAQRMGWGKELIAATVEFSKRLSELNIDKTEFCILNGIVLTYPDAAGLKEKHKVTTLQTNILDSLQKYQGFKYPGYPSRYGKLLLRLPSLRTVSAKAAERFLSLTLDGSLQLNDLVLEMIN